MSKIRLLKIVSLITLFLSVASSYVFAGHSDDSSHEGHSLIDRVVGHTYRFSTQERAVSHEEYIFVHGGQVARLKWAELPQGKAYNLTMARGGWEIENEILTVQFRVQGDEYGEEWVYVNTCFKITENAIVPKVVNILKGDGTVVAKQPRTVDVGFLLSSPKGPAISNSSQEQVNFRDLMAEMVEAPYQLTR